MTDAVGEPVFEQERVIVDIGSGVQITTIAQGAEVSIHGGAVQFQALTDNLTSNAGTFTLSGDGIDNALRRSLGTDSSHALTNTGQVNVLGFTSELRTGDFIQNGGFSATRIGAGANLILFGDLVINDGEIVLEVASRPRENQFGKIKASSADFGDRLVIDFTGVLANPLASVDIGDTWEIIPRTTSAPITGVNTVGYRLEGAPLPADWLPTGSHLEVIQFNTDFGNRGLGIMVVPDSGVKDYYTWAADNGLDIASFSTNPFQDADNRGLEFLFGTNGIDDTASFQTVKGSDGATYLQLTYVRPSGTEQRDATYTPYYTRNMVNWYVAPMFITDISPGPGLNLQQVTLQSNFSITTDDMFFRIQADFNPDNFEKGVIPEKPIGDVLAGLENLGYGVGQVLFFNISGSTDFGSVYGTDIYRDRSALSVAAVHAGVLENGEQGVVKVTILPRQDSFTGSTRHEGSNNEVTSQSFSYSSPNNEPNAVSYRIEEGEEILTVTANESPFLVQIDEGWNLISLPRLPDSESVSRLLEHKIGTVWTWSNGSFHSIETLNPLLGYWVYSSINSSIKIFGDSFVTNDSDSGVVTFARDWNLIGPLVKINNPYRDNILKPIWSWNGRRYEAVSENSGALMPGQGYWINSAVTGLEYDLGN